MSEHLNSSSSGGSSVENCSSSTLIRVNDPVTAVNSSQSLTGRVVARHQYLPDDSDEDVVADQEMKHPSQLTYVTLRYTASRATS